MSFCSIATVAIIVLSTWQTLIHQSGMETNTPILYDNAVAWGQIIERKAQVNDHEYIHTIGQTQKQPLTRARTGAKITVQSSEAKLFDRGASSALMQIRISETFVGDIDGESTVRALQVLRDDQ